MKGVCSPFTIARLALLLVGHPAAVEAAVNDVFPADYLPLPAGQTSTTLYVYERQQDGFHVNGRKQFNGRLDSQVVALRLSQGMNLAGEIVAPLMVMSWAHSGASPASLASAMGPDTAGLGDLRLGFTWWPYSNRETARHLGLTAVIVAPTGRYHPNYSLNIGENRWKGILSAGAITPINDRFLFDLSAEVAAYGDNDDTPGGRLEQAPSWAITSYLRYRISPSWQTSLGWQENGGGETRRNGIDQHNPTENRRAMIGLTWLGRAQEQWVVRYARDLEIENGFKLKNEVVLRFMRVF